jgi:hypothetical protein
VHALREEGYRISAEPALRIEPDHLSGFGTRRGLPISVFPLSPRHTFALTLQQQVTLEFCDGAPAW